jgi:hypothetical protein
MAAVASVKLGPIDHSRPITYGEFLASAGEEGFRYELIDGKVYVSPTPLPDFALIVNRECELP